MHCALSRLPTSPPATPCAYSGSHSVGEFAALVAAGSLRFTDAIELVRFRAHAMTEAVPVGVGAMAAVIGLADDQVRALCAEAAQREIVEPVNFNAPGQVRSRYFSPVNPPRPAPAKAGGRTGLGFRKRFGRSLLWQVSSVPSFLLASGMLDARIWVSNNFSGEDYSISDKAWPMMDTMNGTQGMTA